MLMTNENQIQKPKSKKPMPRSFYLGEKELADRRLERLEEIAREFGLTRSTLIQAIADGELTVTKLDGK